MIIINNLQHPHHPYTLLLPTRTGNGQHMQPRERETAIYRIELKQITERWKREHI